ncbi:hypothetical protein HYC85_016707 [Camellia sinensis]|uniref:Pectinesterase inhibitor domain-containing protein n=1 Tax=Camellia sinensis TaxID=4442 RepID=A0A7J7H0E7_CAMSI|nr:hypothetical protein HYC85_016707 [Camellia sinensis]
MRTTLSFSPLLLLFLFLFLLLLSSSFHRAAAQTLIYNTCKTGVNHDSNIDFTFCTTSLQSAPASQCADLRGLGMITIKLIQNNVTDTRCYVKHLLKNKKLDPYVKVRLQDCLELYSDAIPSVKQAVKYYKSKKFVDANREITSVMDAVITCEDGFLEKKGVVSPLKKRDNDTFQLSAISLSIMNMFQTGSH